MIVKQTNLKLSSRNIIKDSAKEDNYDPAFVKEILKSRDDIKKGRGGKIATEDLWK
ncbi:DUF2683 family protein [Pedobacter nyackensis]|uniref:Uncharacterized protein n=1 Tax=Pedobacter nyackensis TaxID=475255 RepID=A0A1W2DLM3_9SPHI|nr:DUF2683 family protein [Pedobacter nyackensis]SMC97896.1 hypothetical protein SAMN04488101_107121 [Pedobacter nyackensis]